MTGVDLVGMLRIDYVFHIPYILAAGIVAWFFFATSATKADATAGTGRREIAPAVA